MTTLSGEKRHLSSKWAPEGLYRLVRSMFPGAEIARIEPMRPDASGGAGEKVAGYGRPLRITICDDDGAERTIVFRTFGANEFGHERRTDRAQLALLAHDTFGMIPSHVRVLDVGTCWPDGRLMTLHGAGEYYLITNYAQGQPYADDLRRIASLKKAEALDLDRCRELARYLRRLHRSSFVPVISYRRAIRDLVGHGEGIFGIIDGFPAEVPSAPTQRLREIERLCRQWRWRLRSMEHRLARVHGDFHPFNVIFGDRTDFTLLDASRGSEGDPADDVSCMAINYLFFALDGPGSWGDGLGPLWTRFWSTYLEGTADAELLQVVAPFLAWRALVLSNPKFYPGLSAKSRDALLTVVEQALAAPQFDPASVEALFA